MKSPITGKEMQIVKEIRNASFRKEEFEIVFHAYKCMDTGEFFEDDLFAKLNYNQVLNKYREKNSIPFPEQIIAIREKYGVSAIKMSEILGFGVNTYRQYEAGEVPSSSNSMLINLIADTHEFKKAIESNKKLDNSFKIKTIKRIEHLLEESRNSKQERYIQQYLTGSCMPDSFTGYKTPDIKKLANMIIYFAEKTQAWKTKLNKLLFYSDFGMFKTFGQSISGFRYAAIDLGPVPNNFNSLYDFLNKENKISIEYTYFTDGVGELIKKSKMEFYPQLLSSEEIEVMDKVLAKFSNTSTKDIIEISHNEKAWIENIAAKSLIDYKFGFELKAM
ncbi:MAG: DUF4065 domain-containing protein [Bacteroidales bacterium]|jgi:DNA-binding transcriptional regulator YiaG/uncharacterized phage-associated protein|nr:DUF4065 domain-containing protein [Bacteroidales bacterium]